MLSDFLSAENNLGCKGIVNDNGLCVGGKFIPAIVRAKGKKICSSRQM
jgi:hypothetical protein